MKRRIKSYNDIVIKREYIDNFENNYDNIPNKEKELKEIFIKILKDNYDDSVIKLTDIKRKFSSFLSLKLQKNDNLVQILKNLIGSNKDNKTSLIRDPNVDWYYCGNTKNKYIEVDEKSRKPVLLPKELERSHSKKFYAFYTSILDDSLAVTSLEAEENNATYSSEKYNNIDFENISTKKIDYVDKQTRSQEIGNIGEEYIFELEKEKLAELNIDKKPEWVSKKNDSYGFDILSYRKKENGEIYRIYIEVKTTTGNLHNQFYVSKLEMEVSKINSNQYVLTRVYNASDLNEIDRQEYYGDISTNASFESVKSSITSIFKVK